MASIPGPDLRPVPLNGPCVRHSLLQAEGGRLRKRRLRYAAVAVRVALEVGGWLRRADAEADKGSRLLYLTPNGEDVSVLGAECKRGGKPARRLQANRRSEIRVGRFARLLGGEAIGVVDRYTSAATASASARHALWDGLAPCWTLAWGGTVRTGCDKIKISDLNNRIFYRAKVQGHRDTHLAPGASHHRLESSSRSSARCRGCSLLQDR